MKKQSQSIQNLGLIDRQIRATIGSLAVLSVMISPADPLGLSALAALLSIPIISSAIIGWDPLYAVLKLSTYDERDEDITQKHWTYSNIGMIDRGIRLSLGVAMLLSVMTSAFMPASTGVALMAIPVILTAVIAWDPIYAMLGVNSIATRDDAIIAETGATKQSITMYYEFPNAKGVGHRDYQRAA